MYIQQTATLKCKIDFVFKNLSDLIFIWSWQITQWLSSSFINACWDIHENPIKIKRFMGSSIYQICTASSSGAATAGQSNCTLKLGHEMSDVIDHLCPWKYGFLTSLYSYALSKKTNIRFIQIVIKGQYDFHTHCTKRPISDYASSFSSISPSTASPQRIRFNVHLLSY